MLSALVVMIVVYLLKNMGKVIKCFGNGKFHHLKTGLWSITTKLCNLGHIFTLFYNVLAMVVIRNHRRRVYQKKKPDAKCGIGMYMDIN